MHSICFVSGGFQPGVYGKHNLFSASSWIATGCEDRTVRLTRYRICQVLRIGLHQNCLERSICSVSKITTVPSDLTNISDMRNGQNAAMENIETPVLLISVGAKWVSTS
ncbi:PREDICTED: WD repeat-containing 6 [Prunus dulcis]|uniref:PREDICTED: WD repeat-containing 6 n=1 Tax=Prunus dulcis TaxID=3755 RepID=A0A5E4FSP0_PRUDU|nr:PREDICTED: WD repeat-containing 6 [Prunus dulcis]